MRRRHGGDPTLIAASLDEGDAAVAEAYPDAYANAIEAYGRAVEAGGDTDVEANEGFTVTLSGATGGAQIAGATAALAIAGCLALAP